MIQVSDIVSTDGDLATNIRSFARHLRAANLSPKTQKVYLDAANLFGHFLSEAGMPTDVARLNREHLEHFITREIDRTSPSSARVRYGGLRALFKWLEEEGEIDADPFVKMRPPRVGEKPVPVLSVEEISNLLKACSGNSFESRRDLAALRVVATTGIRRAELAGLRWSEDPNESDVDLDRALAVVQGKGNRERLVPFDPRTVKAVDRYVRLRVRHSHADEPWLWLGPKGRLTEDGLRQMLERRADQAGLGHVHMHQFRHSFAHHWLASGGQESDLQRLAGWKSPEMVRRYAASTASERALLAAQKVGLGQFL